MTNSISGTGQSNQPNQPNQTAHNRQIMGMGKPDAVQGYPQKRARLESDSDDSQDKKPAAQLTPQEIYQKIQSKGQQNIRHQDTETANKHYDNFRNKQKEKMLPEEKILEIAWSNAPSKKEIISHSIINKICQHYLGLDLIYLFDCD